MKNFLRTLCAVVLLVPLLANSSHGGDVQECRELCEHSFEVKPGGKAVHAASSFKMMCHDKFRVEGLGWEAREVTASEWAKEEEMIKRKEECWKAVNGMMGGMQEKCENYCSEYWGGN